MKIRLVWTFSFILGSFLWGCSNEPDNSNSPPGHMSSSGDSAASVEDGSTKTMPQTRGPSIVHPPDDLPSSVGKRAPKTIRIDLEAVELEGQLADGTTYTYMTFNKYVPGPLLRVRVEDTVELRLKNAAANQLTHS